MEVIKRLFPPLQGLQQCKSKLQSITKESNDTLLTTAEQTCMIFELGSEPRLTVDELDASRARLSSEFLGVRNAFIEANQKILLRALAEKRAART